MPTNPHQQNMAEAVKAGRERQQFRKFPKAKVS
jgi:hypothetical protein